MEKEKTSNWEHFLVACVVFIIIFPTLRLIYLDMQEERDRDVIQACMNASFVNKALNESLTFAYYSGEKKTAEEVSKDLELTNEQVNKLTTFLNCVNVDLLHNK